MELIIYFKGEWNCTPSEQWTSRVIRLPCGSFSNRSVNFVIEVRFGLRRQTSTFLLLLRTEWGRTAGVKIDSTSNKFQTILLIGPYFRGGVNVRMDFCVPLFLFHAANILRTLGRLEFTKTDVITPARREYYGHSHDRIG